LALKSSPKTPPKLPQKPPENTPQTSSKKHSKTLYYSPYFCLKNYSQKRLKMPLRFGIIKQKEKTRYFDPFAVL
jgi:hypothetical protein